MHMISIAWDDVIHKGTCAFCTNLYIYALKKGFSNQNNIPWPRTIDYTSSIDSSRVGTDTLYYNYIIHYKHVRTGKFVEFKYQNQNLHQLFIKTKIIKIIVQG